MLLSGMTFIPTIWLLDVDGTIFPESKRTGWSANPRFANLYSSEAKDSLRVWWAAALAAELRKIQKSGLVEMIWCSKWCPDADQVERVLGLSPMRRAFTTGDFDAKIQAAKKVHNLGGRLIWTDDVVVPQWGALYNSLTNDGRSLLISPESEQGLQREDIIEIKKFIGLDD